MITNLDKTISIIEAADSIKKTFLERIPSRETDKSYSSHYDLFRYENSYKGIGDRKLNEVLIKPIKFTSKSTSIFSLTCEDDIWITNDTNEFIGKYFIKYINEHKNDIWKFIYEEIKTEACNEKENLLKEVDDLKNKILNM